MNYILEGNANFQDSLLKALCHTETIEQSEQYVRTYNMRVRLNYKKLLKPMDLAIKELTLN